MESTSLSAADASSPSAEAKPKKKHTRFSGQLIGWFHYCYPKDRFACNSAECKKANEHKNNYWLCDPCSKAQWFESKINTFQGDDIERACTKVRMRSKDPIRVHTEMRKVHKKFKSMGGQVRPA
jgi:hypothetical protein